MEDIEDNFNYNKRVLQWIAGLLLSQLGMYILQHDKPYLRFSSNVPFQVCSTFSQTVSLCKISVTILNIDMTH